MHKPSVFRPSVVLASAVAVALLSVLAVPADIIAQAGARERTLFVSAVDDSGKPVPGLTPGDFVVREDGARREVLRVSRALEPVDVVLLVDNSASANSLISPLREGLARFIAAMTEAGAAAPGSAPGNIAIIGLSARPTIIVDFTTDRKRLTDGIGRLFPERDSGMTLLDAIVEISKGLEKRDTPRIAIVPVITDGIEFTNRYYKDVLEALDRSGAGLHALTVGTFSVSDDDGIRNRALVLDEGTRASGGQRVTLLSSSAVPAALEKLAAELTSQYKVVYGRPESLIPPEKIQISAGRPGLTVRATPARGQKTGA